MKEKIAVIKLGGRITYNRMSAVGGEAVSLIKLLNEDFEVHAFTKVLDLDAKFDFDFMIHDIEEEFEQINNMGFSKLIIINGNVNFFGGAEDRAQILNYHIINHFKGKLFYFLCDPYLGLKQIWKSIEKKEWGENYKLEDIYITRGDIICLHQPYDTYETQAILCKDDVKYKELIHFPFEYFPLIYKNEFDNRQYSIPEIDLIYGGTIRSGRREKKLLKYYFNYPKDISVELFGNIKLEHFKKMNVGVAWNLPEFTKGVDYMEFVQKMSTSLVTVGITDEWSEGTNYTQRIYETLMSSCILLLDEDFDPKRKLFDNDFFYVKDKDDVIKRIRALKQYKGTREKLLAIQKKKVDAFSIREYKRYLAGILNGF